MGEEGCGSLDGGRRGGSAVKEGEREDIAAMDGGWECRGLTSYNCAQRLQGSTGCPGFCMVTTADKQLRSVYTQPGSRRVVNTHLQKELPSAYILQN